MPKPIPASDAVPFATLADAVRYHQAMASKEERVPVSDVASFLVAYHENHEDVDPIAEWLSSQFCVDTLERLMVVSTVAVSNRAILRTGDRILADLTQWTLGCKPRQLGRFPFRDGYAVHVDNVVVIIHGRTFSVIFRK